jgi:hypothetical protein
MIKSIYGIQKDLSEEQALEIVRASVETNRHLCRLVSALRGSGQARHEGPAREGAAGGVAERRAVDGTRSTREPDPREIEIDSPAEALQVLVDRAEMTRGDAEQLTPILLGLRRAHHGLAS